MWAFDISAIEDMRSKVQTRMGMDTSREDEDAEKEIEELFASVLAKKEFQALRWEPKVIEDEASKEDGNDEKKS